MLRRLISGLLCSLLTIGSSTYALAGERVIEILADNDSRFKVQGQHDPEIKLRAGEKIDLRITAHRGKRWRRDGAVHGFTMVGNDGMEVPGWNFLLKEGLNEFHVIAPLEPGDYTVICTIVCGRAHDQMNMRVLVMPSKLIAGIQERARSDRMGDLPEVFRPIAYPTQSLQESADLEDGVRG